MPRNTDRIPFQKAIWHRRHVLFIWLHHQVLELIENWSIKTFLLKSLTEFTVHKVQCQNQKRKEKGQYSNLYWSNWRLHHSNNLKWWWYKYNANQILFLFIILLNKWITLPDFNTSAHLLHQQSMKVKHQTVNSVYKNICPTSLMFTYM